MRGMSCKGCINNNTPFCLGRENRIMLMQDFEYDCYTTNEDAEMCEMLCGGAEDEQM